MGKSVKMLSTLVGLFAIGAGLGYVVLTSVDRTETVQGYFQKVGGLCGLSEVERPATSGAPDDETLSPFLVFALAIAACQPHFG